MLTHFIQTGPTCGAMSYRCLLSGLGINISASQAIKECKTKSSGTSIYNVCAALKERGINYYLANLNTDFYSYFKWLRLDSLNRILYVTFHGRNKRLDSNYKATRGRPSEEHHAVIVSEGQVYDSAHDKVVPLEAYVFKYNSQFLIKDMIVVDTPTFKRHD